MKLRKPTEHNIEQKIIKIEKIRKTNMMTRPVMKPIL